MNLFHDIKQKKAPEMLELLVEISRGDFVKYEYNHEYGVLEVDRVLYGPIHFPVVYCDVPQTWNSDDGDPLDAVLFTTGNILPGTLAHGRVVGVMEMEDQGEKDWKIICVNDKDPRYSHVKEVTDLREWELKDMRTFFETYKHAQTGPGTVKVGEFHGAKVAHKLIEDAMKAYAEKFSQ